MINNLIISGFSLLLYTQGKVLQHFLIQNSTKAVVLSEKSSNLDS